MNSIKIQYINKYNKQFVVEELLPDVVYFCEKSNEHYLLGQIDGRKILMSFPNNSMCKFCDDEEVQSWTFVECIATAFVDGEQLYKLTVETVS